LFTNMELIFGPSAVNWEITLFRDYPDFLFAVLPPGAFVGLGLLIAVKNRIDTGIQQRKDARAEKPVAGSKRVRVTGMIG